MTLFEPSVLPVVFVVLMGVAVLTYVVLDGYDLGVGILSGADLEGADRDRMVSSIGPFWDANETWLVLAAGLLLVAFPMAHGIILQALYVPVFVMLVGLILRGVAFEYRIKAQEAHRPAWDRAFFFGSTLTALAQGFMLGHYIVGFDTSVPALAFCVLTALCLAGAYAFIGATWLIYKTEGALQVRAVGFARTSLWIAAAGLVAVSAASPLVSPRVFMLWFSVPNVFLLAPIPILTAFVLGWLERRLRCLPMADDRGSLAPFLATIGVFTLAFVGLAISFFPYIVPERMTVWEAAAADESLLIMLIGTAIVLPIIIGYSAFVYRLFRGKAKDYYASH